MLRTGLLAGSLGVAIMILALTFTSPITADTNKSPDQDRDRPRSAEEINEYTGLVVDLYHYLKSEDYKLGEHDDADVAGRHTGGPVALLTSKEGMIRTGTELRVIVFASREDVARLRDRVGELVGKRVHVTGYECKREGTSAVAIQNVTDFGRTERGRREDR